MDTQQTQFKDLNEFLAKHNANSEKREGVNISLTHTRIPDRALGIYGGSYISGYASLPRPSHASSHRAILIRNRRSRRICL